MDILTLAPIVIFIGTIGALLYLRYRDYASLTQAEKEWLHAESSRVTLEKAGGRVQSLSEHIDELMPAFISVVVLLSSIYVILSANYGEAQNKWALGSIGMILGYWLRSTAKSAGRGRKRSQQNINGA